MQVSAVKDQRLMSGGPGPPLNRKRNPVGPAAPGRESAALPNARLDSAGGRNSCARRKSRRDDRKRARLDRSPSLGPRASGPQHLQNAGGGRTPACQEITIPAYPTTRSVSPL